MSTPPRVTVIGPTSWNHIIVLDELPEPRPHMQVAVDSWWTVGGTSAGKALHLRDLGADVTLVTPIADDERGARVRAALERAGVDVTPVDSDVTESHTNLMSRAGGRVSLYTHAPGAAIEGAVATALRCARDADAVVVDMSPLGRAVLPGLAHGDTPVWTDLHDWNGVDDYHRAFAEAGTVVMLNDDGGGDRDGIMRAVHDRGARLVIRTLGAEGAVALDGDARWHRVPAEPAGSVVDTNGAGDAFAAGALVAHAAGADPAEILAAGARQALRALGTRHLSPLLD